MTITAKVIADSISPAGIRLTTLQLRYPKFIHGEFMTHRVFSRNASSSRAIPVERLLADVRDDPAMPVFWGKNQSGMQANEELSAADKEDCIAIWQAAAFSAYKRVKLMAERGAHKQIVNRIIEPWCHINVVVTSTEWANFDALRRHKDAQPEMQLLADTMAEARNGSVPNPLRPGEWHLPYVTAVDQQKHMNDNRPENWTVVGTKLSVARCARVSYLTHEGKEPNMIDDLALYDRLMTSVPLHASPAEHQATPDYAYEDGEYLHTQLHGNFVGWRQYRKMLPDECVKDR